MELKVLDPFGERWKGEGNGQKERERGTQGGRQEGKREGERKGEKRKLLKYNGNLFSMIAS